MEFHWMVASRRFQAARRRTRIGLLTAAAWCAASAANAVPATAAPVLPDGRGYEFVSRGADLADIKRVPAVAPDGNAVAYSIQAGTEDATSSLAASTYVARRGPDGWDRTEANLPVPRKPEGWTTGLPNQFRPDLRSYLTVSAAPVSAMDQDDGVDLYRGEVGSPVFDWRSPSDVLPAAKSTNAIMYLIGAAPDLSRAVFWLDNASLLTGGPIPGVWVSDADGVRLASVLPNGMPASQGRGASFATERRLNDDAGAQGSAAPYGGRHGASVDGTRVYFYDGNLDAAPLYLRAGDTTLAVSASHRAADPGTMHPAAFIGASRDGGVAYFASPDQLTEDAAPGGGIYRFALESNTLSLVTPPSPAPAGLGLHGAMLSDDATHVYFTTPVKLTADAGSGGLFNAYVVDDGATRLIATGLPADSAVTRVSRDGRYAVLQTTAPLTNTATGGHASLYLYDDQKHTLACASCRPDGTPSGGDAGVFTAPPGLLPTPFTQPRNLTTDGRLFFTTTDQLVADDANGALDVYEYDHGVTSLLTSGHGDADAYLADNTDDGRDVFLLTRDALSPADKDAHELDLYDARVGGGDPPAPSAPAPCRDDGCQPVAAGRPQLATAMSTSASGPGNVAKKAPVSPRKRSVVLLPVSSAARRSAERTGWIRLGAKVSGGGTVTVRAEVGSGGRMRAAGQARRTVRSATTVTAHLRLRLSDEVRRMLRHRRRLTVRLTAALAGSPAIKHRSVTLNGGRS